MQLFSSVFTFHPYSVPEGFYLFLSLAEVKLKCSPNKNKCILTFLTIILWNIFPLLYGAKFENFCTPNQAISHCSKIFDHYSKILDHSLLVYE